MSWRVRSLNQPGYLSRLVALIICGGLVVPSAAGAWVPDGTPLCDLPGSQAHARIVSDGGTGSIVVWADERSGAGDIYAQRLDVNGNPLWTPEGVAICSAAGRQFDPEITTDEVGGAIIAWIDSRSGGDDVYAQRVDGDGNVLWTVNGVAVCTAANNQYAIGIAPGGGSGVVMAWQDLRNGTNYDIYAQRVGSDGTMGWQADGRPICTAAGHQYRPKVVSDGSYGAIITWYDHRTVYSDVYAQRLNLAGTPQWTSDGVVVCSASYDQIDAVIASDGAGGAIIAWQDARNGGNWDVYAQRMTSTGTASWAANGVAVCTYAGTQNTPRLVSDAAGGAVVVWVDFRGADGNIYCQRLSSGGAVLWTANGVLVCGAGDIQYGPAITTNGNGGAIIVWQDSRGGTSADIYAQEVSSAGLAEWSPDGVAICSSQNNQLNPEVAADGCGGAVIVWQDYRSGASYDVYAQFTDYVVAVPDEPGVPATAPRVAELDQNHPNPFNPLTKIAFTLTEATRVRLCVHDGTGRLVRVLKDDTLGAGRHELAWDGRDGAGSSVTSGVYFYILETPAVAGGPESRKMVMIR